MSIPCRKVFSETILEEAKKDTSIMVLCTDSRGSVMIGDFADELPEQFVEVGIAEQNCVGLAAGLANVGLKPYICGPACFLSMRSAEQIKVDLAYSHSNVKVIAISGGVSYGALGATHHSLQDIALMNAVPDIKIILPSDNYQTIMLTKELLKEEGPAYVRMGRGAVPDIYQEGESFQIGKAKVLMEGEDIGIIGAGETVYYSLEAGRKLKSEGIHATVVDLHTIKPIDKDTLHSITKKVKKLIVVEEHSINGGVGSIISSLYSEDTTITVRKLALPDTNMVTGSSNEIFNHYGLSVDNIIKNVKELLEK